MTSRPIVIVGGGLAGLTVGCELARHGREVVIVERDAEPGGLARTFRHGAFAFDVGPHRFHAEDGEAAAFIAATLGADAVELPRASAVRAFGATHAWPLRAAVLRSLPPSLMLRAARDLAWRERLAGESFEAEIVGRYGRTLFDTFFGPYTRRFLGLSPDRVHRDWARASVDRAVIDPRVRADGLLDLLRGALLPPAAETRFLYPEHGVGAFADRLAERFAASGGRLLLGAEVGAVEVAGGRIEALVAAGERLAASAVVWTAPVTTALRLLGHADGGLRFLSTVLFNLELRSPPALGFQWVYLAEEEAFVRVSEPAAFSAAMTPAGRGSLCVERTCREGDATWARPERHLEDVVDALVRNGFIRSRAEVSAVHVERVADTYPIYELGYREALAGVRRTLAGHRNLLLAGRSGGFWYNNMDHSIAQALRVAAGILAADGADVAAVDPGAREFWRRPR